MKRINLKGLSEVLSEKELKNVLGGSSDDEKPCGLYCFNGGEMSCGVDVCPSSISAAEQLCLTEECGGKFGPIITCGGGSKCYQH